MGKIYLVDSENVGDIWVPLLVSSQEDDEVLVFYTTKSPHMNYENVRMLKETEKEADFIKCFEGSNALDFQLVSELGYRLSQNADREYVIVSNDTGFDAAVRYWSTRKMPVSRLSGKECHRMLTEKKQRVTKETGAAAEPEQEHMLFAGYDSLKTAQSGFARNLPADFPPYCPENFCRTQRMPAKFRNSLPKNPAAHLTHKLGAVLL